MRPGPGCVILAVPSLGSVTAHSGARVLWGRLLLTRNRVVQLNLLLGLNLGVVDVAGFSKGQKGSECFS